MKELNSTEVEFILGQMKSLEHKHPKATVLYDPENRRVNITYPLPKDFYKIREIREL